MVRSISTFQKNNDDFDDQELNYDDQGHVLLMNKAAEPLDILWKNLGFNDSPFMFMRFFLFVIGLVLIIWLSSPVVVLNSLSQTDTF